MKLNGSVTDQLFYSDHKGKVKPTLYLHATIYSFCVHLPKERFKISGQWSPTGYKNNSVQS